MKIDNIRLPIDANETKLWEIAKKKYRFGRYLAILKKSLDARNKEDIHWIYSVEFSERPIVRPRCTYLQVKKKPMQVLVVGSGPAGLFCAIRLIRSGIIPIVIERGGSVEERIQANDLFFQKRKLDPNCNVQFGEGGAGTFSDGKLNTQTKDIRNQQILEMFVEFGAPEEILYLNKPHIGSDVLRRVVKNMRQFIVASGGQIKFHSFFEDFNAPNNQIVEAVIRNVLTGSIEKIPVSEAVLAIGHSSRDTFQMLVKHKVAVQPRAFAVGVRIEHLQEKINFAQYGVRYNCLPAADYKLVSHAGARSAFTFCMCPGGYVIPAASEVEGIVTNGMSNYARDAKNANSALLVQIQPEDYLRGDVLDGVKFQRALEQKAFLFGGKDYSAPVQRVEDFLIGRPTQQFGEVLPSYAAGTALADLNRVLPSYISETLKAAIFDMDQRLRGFASPDAVLTAVETRFSSPVRVLRDEQFECVSIKGIYPCGEGCGYSGGIMSSAVDGIRVAEKISEKYGAL